MADVYYIPDGPKNLASLFAQVSWDEVQSYQVQLLDDFGITIGTTVQNIVDTCCDNSVRIHFLNYLGTIDAIDFKLITKEHEAKSSSFQKPLSYPLQKTSHSTSRTNVKTTDSQTGATVDYSEDDQTWLDELIDSPLAWLEWKGTQGQPDSYMPIVISDMKKDNVKEDERFTYEVSIEFTISNARVTIRN